MARLSTRARVFGAVIELASDAGLAPLTMEGIAARARVGKQTLYRSWPSIGAILFDALLHQNSSAEGVVLPDTGDLRNDLEVTVRATLVGLEDFATDRLYRSVAAEIQGDPELAQQLLTRLLRPQLEATQRRLEQAGIVDSAAGAELLFGPIFYRWLLRLGPMSGSWASDHVDRVIRALGS